MFKASPLVMRATLEQLERATRDHAEWNERLNRTLVCRLPVEPDDIAANAHHLCRFGRWYYGNAPAALRDQPAFAAIEEEHRRLHAMAAALLLDVSRGAAVAQEGYDELVTVAARLRLQLDSLRHEIRGALQSTDALTGAYGRAEVLPELREARELVRRKVERCCIAFMDVDRLKQINDQHGHTVGDQVLAGAVRYLAEHLRPYDKVFRYGGDEFLILMPGADLEEGRRVIERLRAGLENVPFVVSADGRAIHATASFGLVQLAPDLRVEESIDRADKAVLLAKTSGRNRVIAWDPAVTTGTVLTWSAVDDDPIE